MGVSKRQFEIHEENKWISKTEFNKLKEEIRLLKKQLEK